MRLLLATYAYPPSIGGVERHSQTLARALLARGHDVRIVTAAIPGAPSHEVDDAGVVVERVDPGSGSRWTKMLTFLTGMTAATVRHRRTVDVVHVQQALYPAAAMAVVARAIGKPLVVRNSGSGAHGAVQVMSRLPFGRLGLGLIRRSATAVSLSTEMTAEMRVAGFATIETIPNGVEVRPYRSRAAARRALGLAEDARVVLYAGRLDREKGIRLLAAAWPRVAAQRALLIVVGDGPERDLLGGLRDVRQVGAVADVSPYYAAADAFVLPSESEGISNALLEAMAAGLPVVATAVGGNRAVLSDERLGILVPSHDAAALAAGLDRVLADPAVAKGLGEAARAHVEARWSQRAMVDAYERLYVRLAASS